MMKPFDYRVFSTEELTTWLGETQKVRLYVGFSPAYPNPRLQSPCIMIMPPPDEDTCYQIRYGEGSWRVNVPMDRGTYPTGTCVSMPLINALQFLQLCKLYGKETPNELKAALIDNFHGGGVTSL